MPRAGTVDPAPLRWAKALLHRRVGWHRLMETRNKVLLSWTAPKVASVENAEVRRLRRKLGTKPSALVVTVMATYRRPDRLLVAVRSALAQTVTDHVVVVVDDGGGLPELPADPRLVAVSLSRNTGELGSVRNVGIRLSDSPYLAFLDDDNEWEPDHLEAALARLQGTTGSGPRPDAVYTALRRVLPDGSEKDVLSVPFDRRSAARQSFMDANSFVMRRTRLLRFSRLHRARGVMPREDWEMMFRFSRHHRVEHLPKPTVRYLVNPESFYTTWTAQEASIQEAATREATTREAAQEATARGAEG